MNRIAIIIEIIKNFLKKKSEKVKCAAEAQTCAVWASRMESSALTTELSKLLFQIANKLDL